MSYQNYNKEKRPKIKPQNKANKLPPINKNLLMIVLMLIIFGTVAIFSATTPEGVTYYENPLHYPMKHLMFGAIGIFVMAVVSKIHYQKWQDWVIPFSLLVIFAIVATLIPGLGKTDYGSSRWLSLGPIQIQPSEFCKFTCILIMATVLSKIKNLWCETFGKYCALLILMAFIIYKQPNMSMLIILAATVGGMLLVSGLNKTFFIGLTALGASGIGFLIANTAYQSSRIIGWLRPYDDPKGAGYNIIQSWYAIASGGLLGVGLGASKQKLHYLPVGYTDFIFAVIAEEMGFIGVTVLVLLFLLFINIGFKIANRCQDNFGKLLAFGIVFNIGSQAIINMCVASGLFPVTGVTLPLISYGGSSFIATCLMLGVLFNISRYAVKKERKMDNGQIPQT